MRRRDIDTSLISGPNLGTVGFPVSLTPPFFGRDRIAPSLPTQVTIELVTRISLL